MRNSNFIVYAIAAVAAAAAGGALNAQIGSMGAGSSSQMYQAAQQETPEHRAAEAYNRAARDIKKAEGAKDANDRHKLYEKAKGELKKSLDIKPNYDALLAMGRVALALGDPGSALDFCTQAESYRSGDAASKACKDEATRQASAASAAPAEAAAAAPQPANPPPPDPNRAP